MTQGKYSNDVIPVVLLPTVRLWGQTAWKPPSFWNATHSLLAWPPAVWSREPLRSHLTSKILAPEFPAVHTQRSPR